MTLPALYIVRKDGWYAERTVWAIAGVALSTGTLLAWLAHPAFALLILGTGLLSLGTAFSGFCVMSTLLVNLGFDAKLRAEPTSLGGVAIYRMQTDRWFLERGIYVVVGTTQTLGAVLSVVHSPWWLAFTGFVGAMSIAFAWSGFCPVANVLWYLGFEPRLAPEGVTARAGSEAACARAA